MIKKVPKYYVEKIKKEIPIIPKFPLHYVMEDLKPDKKSNDLWLEFGVGCGHSINYISKFTQDIVYGFDSFEGLPEKWRDGFDIGSLSMNKKPPIVNHNVMLIQGLFQDTLSDFLKSHDGQISFIHLDADLYSSTKYVLDNIKDRLKNRTIIVFDELVNYPGFDNDKGELLAWYEFITDYDIEYEWIGMCGKFEVGNSVHPDTERVAVIIKSIRIKK